MSKYTCQWSTGYERLSVVPSSRHAVAVQMSIGPGVVGSVHLDSDKASDLIADLAALMVPVQGHLSCDFFGCNVQAQVAADTDGEPGSVQLDCGRGRAYFSKDKARALAFELLRLSNVEG